MTMNLPRPPAPERLRLDPDGYARDMGVYLVKFSQEVEREMRIQESPVKDPFAVTNIPDPTTTLDGGTAVLGDVINFLGGLYAALLAKGLIRTRAGAP